MPAKAAPLLARLCRNPEAIPGFYCRVGLAVSRDDGTTFVKRGPILTGQLSKIAGGRFDQGVGEPCAEQRELDQVGSVRVRDAGRTQPLGHDRDQLRRRTRVTGREQRHLVLSTDELFREPGDDPFRSSISNRRDRLVERRELRDPHRAAQEQ